jgi:hypothetical protein
MPDGIGLHEPAERGRVHASLVVVQPGLGQPHLASILEPAAVGRGRDAPLVIAAVADHRAAVFAVGDDRALVVVEQERAAAGSMELNWTTEIVPASKASGASTAACKIMYPTPLDRFVDNVG